jgi:alcohol dehydrogenase (cytochrome c)
VGDQGAPRAYGGALATAGGVVFYGTMEGWLKAVDAKTGKVLWKFKNAFGIIGNPMTYVGPDGRQYVAVLSGIGGLGRHRHRGRHRR